MLGTPGLVCATGCALCDVGYVGVLPLCEGSHGGVVLSNGLVDADVFQLTEAVVLVNLDECEWTGELVGAPEVFNEEVGNGYGFNSSRNSDAPLPGL